MNTPKVKHWYIYFIGLMLAFTAHASEMTAVPTSKNLITEIWCVDGYRVLYVEKTTNETFQFFQVTQNAGIAVKAIECNGTEVREVK